MQYPTANDEPKTVQAYKRMLSSFTTEHNPIGSTREPQIMAWKTLKWDPSKEKLDDFVYKFRRVARELGYDADDNLEVLNCCVPSHLYLYLKGATTIKEAMENIKRASALGGVSVQATPSPTETKAAPVVPFMQMKTLKTVSIQEDVVKDNMANNLDKLSQIIDKQLQLAEKQSNDSRCRGRRREKRNSRDRRRSRYYDRSSSYDKSSSYDRSKSRDRSNSRDRSSRDRKSRDKNINQNSRDKRKNSGTRYSSNLFCDFCKMTNHCYRLHKVLKKHNHSVKEDEKGNRDEQKKYQMYMDFKNFMDSKDPTN